MKIKELTLTILAAGIGKRYGGLKQIEKIGPNGERLIDYSVLHASQAGFKNVVLVIRPEIEEYFNNLKSDWEKKHNIKISYCYQTIEKHVPEKINLTGRNKPWGTAHAILCAKENVHTPFCVINADDYYGKTSYEILADFLKKNNDENIHAMVSFPLENTISTFGTVSRGVCKVNSQNLLEKITEYTQISINNGVYNEGKLIADLSSEVPVSMNFWGFMPSIFLWLETQFHKFFEEIKDLSKVEHYITSAIDKGIEEKIFKIQVLESKEKWLGITYPQDTKWVKEEIKKIQ